MNHWTRNTSRSIDLTGSLSVPGWQVWSSRRNYTNKPATRVDLYVQQFLSGVYLDLVSLLIILFLFIFLHFISMFLLKKYSLIFYFKHSNTLTIISFFECKNKEKIHFPFNFDKTCWNWNVCYTLACNIGKSYKYT